MEPTKRDSNTSKTSKEYQARLQDLREKIDTADEEGKNSTATQLRDEHKAEQEKYQEDCDDITKITQVKNQGLNLG